MAKGYCDASTESEPMEQGQFSLKKWESEKHKSWSLPAEGFKGPRRHGRLSSGYCRKVGSMWLVSDAIGL